MLLILGAVILLLILGYFGFVNFYPSFGGDVSKELQKEYAKSNNYKNGKFVNEKEVPKELGFAETLKVARKFFFTKVPNGVPEKNLEVQEIDSIDIATYKKGTRLIWFGHSAFLLQIKNKTILLDPMFGEVAAPHPWLGSKRFSKELPIAIEKLPSIDAVLISHDHYDHLDYGSIKKLKDKVKKFYVPLGVEVHLETWGVDKERIVICDWWQEEDHGELQFVCTPAQHFSGRKLTNGQSTLWSSWVIRSKDERIFFSGDSGYGEHFKAIGKNYGPFDLALMECGQYNESWPDIHMFPEETAQAGADVGAKAIMPIHWGAFKLALHDWTDPVQRVSQRAKELQIPVWTPKIGESVYMTSTTASEFGKWWQLN